MDSLIIVVDGTIPEAVEDAARQITNRLTDDTDHFDNVYAPRLDKFFYQHALLYPDAEEIQNYADRLAQMQPFLGSLSNDPSIRGLFELIQRALDATIRQDAPIDLSELLQSTRAVTSATLENKPLPMSWQALMSGDQPHQHIIFAQPQLGYGELLAAGSAIRALREIVAQYNTAGGTGVRVRVTGPVALNYEEMATVSKGAGTGALGSIILAVAVLTFAFRASALIVATMLSIICGLSITAGFATLSIGSLNLISIAFAVLYIGLGIPFALHFSLRYLKHAESGMSPTTACQRTASETGVALAWCAITTASGFYAFVPTQYSGVAQLGIISGTGMFITCWTTLTLIPAIISLWPDITQRTKSPAKLPLVDILQLPFRYSRQVVITTVLISLIILYLLPSASFDRNPLNLRDPDSESVATFNDLLATSNTSPWSGILLTRSMDTERTIIERLQSLPEVQTIRTLNSFVPTDQAAKLAIIEDIRLILSSAWQKIRFYEEALRRSLTSRLNFELN